MPRITGRVWLPLLVLSSCSALRLTGPGDAAGEDVPDSGPCVFKEWGSTEYLEGVQILPLRTDHLPFARFDHGSTERTGLLVYPPADLAMCIIEKNGCSAWQTIWNMLTHNSPRMRSPWYGVVTYHWSEQSAARVFERPTSSRILWVRDPLERFLSGYLDKCVLRGVLRAAEDGLRVCSFLRFRNGTSNGDDHQLGFPLSRVQAWFRAGHAIEEANSHFTPQASHCELRRRLQEYNIIGLMTKASFARDASCILERAHLSIWNERGGEGGKPFFSTTVHTTTDAERNEAVLKKFYTREFAEFMLDVFKEDYALFRIRKPEWVKHATGEWFYERSQGLRDAFNVSESYKCRGPEEAPEAEGDEDDLPTLASRAGFGLPE